MTTTEETVEVLNDLIMINNDRIEGYQTAIDETKDMDDDLKQVFGDMIDESRDYITDLSAQVGSLGGEVEKGTTAMGKIYRAWMDVKTAVSGHDRKSILAACEFGEDQAMKAYKKALEHDDELDTDTRSLIVKQRSTLKQSHDKIRAMRDSA